MARDDDRARRGLRLVSTVVRAFAASTTDYDRLLTEIVRTIAEAIPDTCTLALRSEDGLSLFPVAVYDVDPAITTFLEQARRAYPLADVPLQARAPEGTPLFMPRIDYPALAQRLPADALEFFRALDVRGLVIQPFAVRGELLGVISVLRRRPELAELDELDREIIEDLAGHAAFAIENARLFGQLRAELARRQTAEQISDALRIAEERAVESSQFLDAIVENIPDMVFVKEAQNLSFVRFNRAGEELIGVPREQLVGKNDFDLFPRSEAEFFVGKDRETLLGGKLVEIAEESIQTRSGMRWLQTKKVPIVDRSGAPRFLLGISRDITERKRADARLEAARQATENANHELESFAYSVAHDLRAPLRGILGYSEAVLEDHGAEVPDGAKRYLHRMHESAERMAVLIDDLLGLSRVTQAELVRSRVDLTAIAYSTAAGLQQSDPQRDVTVIIQPGLTTEGDPHLLAIVIEHLLGNAWKFTAKRERARIELGTTTRDGEPAFFVRDDGAGFDMAYAGQLFGVFQRLHRETEFSGTGIGLAIVARIIHRHHGRVWGEGYPDKGATFYFTIGEPP